MPEKIPKETPSFYAIVPADVRYCSFICMGAKLLYGEITALCNRQGYCWASNNYFAELYQKDTNTISRWIKELTEAGFIHAEVNKKEGNQRRVYLSTKMPEAIHKISHTPNPKNVVTPNHKNGEYNNTVPNNTFSNSKKTERASPSPEDLQERKKKFFNMIKSHKAKSKIGMPDLLYEKFFTYWSEVNELKGTNKMRCELETAFEIGKRLATFWARVTDEERAVMWKQQEMKTPTPQQQLDFGNLLKTNIEEWK